MYSRYIQRNDEQNRKVDLEFKQRICDIDRFEKHTRSRDLKYFPYAEDELGALDFYKKLAQPAEFSAKFGKDATSRVIIKPFQCSPRHANVYVGGELVAKSFFESNAILFFNKN